MSQLEYRAALRVLFSLTTAFKIRRIDRYRPRSGDNTGVLAKVITDYLFTCPSRYVLSRSTARSFGYEFSNTTSYDVWPGLELCAPPNKRAKACHGFELPYVFGNPATLSARHGHKFHVFDPAEKSLSRSMMSYWSSFATARAPVARNAVPWIAFSAQHPHRQILGTPIESRLNLNRHCDFWDDVGYGQKGLFDRL